MSRWSRERNGRIGCGETTRRAGWRSRIAVVAGVATVVVVAYPMVAWAAPGGIAEVQRFASRLTNYVTAVAASVAILFIAVNGIRWTMSSGNPSRQAEAKNGLVAAGAGLAIALSANLVVNLVVAALR
ncbi:MAG: Type secretion system pilin [Pseudonocardiales bacterium]|nr:Type secretion system pilin [Pseudonocardiales bacterium]